MGIWGVFLGIPVYASAKVVIGAIFEWYKVVSGLYEEHNEIEEETHSERHSQQMVEALDRQELEEAEVQFQQALLEDSEHNCLI